jgi:hypothetical protein
MSSSADDGLAESECGSIGRAPGVSAIDTTTGFAPHDPAVTVTNTGGDAFPSESVATTLACQVPPATSGTNDGLADDVEDNNAELPAGRVNDHEYDNVGAAAHDDDALTLSPTESPAKNCPGAYTKPPAPPAGVTDTSTGSTCGAAPHTPTVMLSVLGMLDRAHPSVAITENS